MMMISQKGVESGHGNPVAGRRGTTRLTECGREWTVRAVARSTVVSTGDSMNGWPIPPRRRLQTAAGSHAKVGINGKSWEWIDGMVGVSSIGGAVAKPLENEVFSPKTRTPPAGSAGGVRRKPKNFRIGNLPACLHGIVAGLESARDPLGVASVRGALHAMEHTHDRRPQGRLRMFGV